MAKNVATSYNSFPEEVVSNVDMLNPLVELWVVRQVNKPLIVFCDRSWELYKVVKSSFI